MARTRVVARTTGVVVLDVEPMCPTIVVVVEKADGVRALGASSISAPVFLVPAVAAALLLLLGSGWTILWELKELLWRLLLLLREEGDLLL